MADIVADLNAAGDRIARDPDDPRDGIILIPPLQRLVLLIPCVLDRLDAELPRLSDAPPALDALRRLEHVVDAIAADRRDELNGVPDALSLDVAGEWRFFRDLRRLDADLQIWLTMLVDQFENRRSRPPQAPDEETGTPEEWLEYLREQMRLEEPVVALVEAEGLSPETLEIGFRRAEADRERTEAHMETWLERTGQDEAREGVFDRLEPSRFLDLNEIPGAEEVELPPPDDAVEEDEADEETEPFHEIESDPAQQRVREFTLSLMRRFDGESSPLSHYISTLALRAGARLASHLDGSAERRGARLFAAECAERIAEALRRLGPESTRSVVREAADLASTLRGWAIE